MKNIKLVKILISVLAMMLTFTIVNWALCFFPNNMAYAEGNEISLEEKSY